MQHVYSSPKSVTAGVRPCPLAMQHFYSCVSQACHWWCPPFSAGISILASAGVCLSIGHEAFLFICLPGPLLLVSALFRWPCSISIHLSPRHFYSFVSHVISFFLLRWCFLPCPLEQVDL